MHPEVNSEAEPPGSNSSAASRWAQTRPYIQEPQPPGLGRATGVLIQTCLNYATVCNYFFLAFAFLAGVFLAAFLTGFLAAFLAISSHLLSTLLSEIP